MALPQSRRHRTGARPETGARLKLTDAILLNMASEARQHNAQFLVVVMDMQLQSNPDQKLRDAFLREHHMASLDRAEKRLLGFLGDHGIAAKSLPAGLLPQLPAGVALRGLPGRPIGEGHYNLRGHDLVASYLADLLMRESKLLNP